jgi:hypothetical protein
MVNQRYRRLIANSTVWSDFIIVLEPSVHFSACVVKAHAPMDMGLLWPLLFFCKGRKEA